MHLNLISWIWCVQTSDQKAVEHGGKQRPVSDRLFTDCPENMNIRNLYRSSLPKDFMDHSRRRFLGATAVASTAAVAGCLDDIPLIGGNGIPDFAGWVPADRVLDDDEPTVTYMDVPAIRDWPDDPLPSFDDEGTMFEIIGVEEDEVEGVLDVIAGGINSVTFGSFDLDAIDDAMDDDPMAEHVDDYEDFLVYEWGVSEFAFGEDALLMMDNYEEFIDVSVGDEPSVDEEDETWEEGLEAVGSFDMVNLEVFGDFTVYDYQDEIELLATGVEYDGDEYYSEGYYYFADADDAEDAFDEIEEEQEEDDDLDDFSLEQDGATIIAEGTFEEFDIPEF